jgi:hypothetical protein
VLLLALLLIAKPLAPISYTACVTEHREEADLAARRVSDVAQAKWCVTLVKVCEKADVLIFVDSTSSETFTVSETCRDR